MNTEMYVNRIKLVDEPFVKQMLMNKYKSSKIQFIDADFNKLGFDWYIDGFRQSIKTIRNSNKFKDSNYFTVSVDKNDLTPYSNTLYAFIDEARKCIYLVSGLSLLQYIVENPNCIMESQNKKNSYYALIPKKAILTLLELENESVKNVSNSKSIIYYNKKLG